MRVKSYEDLRVWQDSIKLTKQVYLLIRKFPREEQYALADQLRRAVVSIPANIAEGQARRHTKEFIQFLHVARASTAEIDTLIVLGRELGYLDVEEAERVREDVAGISRMLSGLIRSLNAPRATSHGRCGTPPGKPTTMGGGRRRGANPAPQ